MASTTPQANNLPIVWLHPNGKGKGENRSKLLAPDSALYQTIECVFVAISSKFVVDAKRMDYHIEISSDGKDPEFEIKSQSISNQTVNVHDINNWGFSGRAFVLFTPPVANSTKDTHITVAFWKENRPSLDALRAIVKEALNL